MHIYSSHARAESQNKLRNGFFYAALFFAAVIFSSLESTALAQEEDEVKISDNSFLIEEAYNQEPGVVQHIFNWVPSWERGANGQRAFDFTFTQEWPLFSQKHQISYVIPLSSYNETPAGGGGSSASGLGDIILNYRYQLLNDDPEEGEKKDFVACAPRFSLILPSGDPDLGLGNGKLGYQVNIPFSKSLERSAYHFNMGLTATPGVTAGVNPAIPYQGDTLNGYNLGGSAIYFLKPNFHLMLEVAASWEDQLLYSGLEDKQCNVYLSPGFRWAPYTKDNTQWTLGLGLPIGVTPETPDIGVFFYMSFEHGFKRKTGGETAGLLQSLREMRENR